MNYQARGPQTQSHSHAINYIQAWLGDSIMLKFVDVGDVHEHFKFFLKYSKVNMVICCVIGSHKPYTTTLIGCNGTPNYDIGVSSLTVGSTYWGLYFWQDMYLIFEEQQPSCANYDFSLNFISFDQSLYF